MIRFKSLSSRVIANLLAVLGGLFLFLSINLTALLDDFSQTEQNRNIAQIDDFLNASLAPLLFAQDFASAQHFLNELEKKHPEILHIKVQDTFGHTAAHIDQHTHSTPKESHAELIRLSKSIDLSLANEKVGSVEYTFKFDQYETLKQQLQTKIIISIVLAILMVFLLVTLIMRHLTKELKNLTIASKAISQGNDTSNLPVAREDEIGQLTNSFNEMKKAIKDRTFELKLEQNRLSSLLNTMNLGVLFETSDKNIKYYNSAFSAIWKLDREKDIHDASLQSVLEQSPLNIVKRKQQTPTHSEEELHEYILNNGQIVLESHMLVHQTEAGNGHLWVYEDITHERQMQQELHRMAAYDALTGLYNRHSFNQEIKRMAAYAKRHGHFLALLFFDIDEFKLINDTYGHSRGDEALILIANTVKNLIREEEWLCRLGGDEFALLSLVDTPSEAEELARRILDSIAETYHHFNGDTIRLTTSIGISHYPQPSEDPDLLPAHADIAMYQAKARGKNTFCAYNPDTADMDKEFARLSWKETIDYALKNNGFEIHYQGIYSCQNSDIHHLESLIRLKDKEQEGQLIYPDRFIPVAEKSGQILEIDRYVIRHAIETLATHPNMPSIAINISGKSFDDITLPTYINELMQLHSIPTERLLIELTETETVCDIQDAETFIQSLHNIGCTVCLDDFGTGFASFSYLKHLEVDVLKIDGTFIKDLDSSFENRLFVESIVSVAKGMGKRTIAEFVENEEILQECIKLGVDMVQGYHLDKPQKDHPALHKSPKSSFGVHE
ncbi:MAG: EAL domain-containing protein [Pseudomonadota bacterium]|nr:EAL domain-containing protein [Pseudomonadota bacterium]